MRKPSLLDDLLEAGKSGVQSALGGAAAGTAVVGETLAKASNTRLGTDFDDDLSSVRSIAAGLAADADASRARISERGQRAMADTTPRGNLLKGEFDLGADPSLRGAALNVTQGLGSAVPSIAAGLLTRGRSVRAQTAVGAAAGGLTGGGFAAQDEGARIRAMAPEELARVPGFVAAIGKGQSPEQARESVAKDAERGAFAATAPVSAAGGAATSALLGKPVQGLLGRAVGNNPVARAAGSTLAGGLEEGVQETAEGVAQIAGANAATGEDRDVGEGSAANFALGAATGGATGLGAGLLPTGSKGPENESDAPIPASAPGPSAPQAQQPAAPAVVNPRRGVLSRAVTAGAAEGAVPNVVIDDTGLDSPPGPFVPEMIPPTPPAYVTPAPVTRQMLEGLQVPGQTGYATKAPARLEGEDTKTYAKRAIDTLPDPEPAHLPQDPGAYFQMKAADLVVPLDQLMSVKDEPAASRNAVKRMAAAADGMLDRRAPIDVRVNDDGTYTVLEGNATLGAAHKVGLPALPVRIVEAPAGQESWRIARGYLDDGGADALTREYEVATGEELGFRADVEATAAAIGGRAIIAPIKGRHRAEEKVALDYAGDVSKINDLIRATVEVDTLEQAQQAIERAGASFHVLRSKNYFDPSKPPPYAGGYRDAKLFVMTRGGAKAELQVNLKPMLAAKEKAHRFYEDWRVLDAKITGENRAPTPEERAQLQQLDAQMQAIYQPAWEAVVAGTGNSASNAAASTSTPLRATESRENARGAAPSSANTPPVAPSSNTGTPSTSKNREPSGNFIGVSPGNGSVDGSTLDTAGLDRKATQKPTTASFGVIVAPKPGTKVETADGTRPYQRGVDGASQPPAMAPVQREADLSELQQRAQAILTAPEAMAALRQLFGVKGLNTRTIRGSYEGTPELSFQLSAEGLTEDNARRLSLFLGMAFAQDAVIVTKPDPVAETEDSIPTIELYNTDDTAMDAQTFEAVASDLRARGIDYSEARDGRALRVLHFGGARELTKLAKQLQQVAATHGLDTLLLHTRSDLHEAQDYRHALEGSGPEGGEGFGPEVFRALVDHFAVPYVRAIGAVGYRFDPDRYAARFRLSEAERGQLIAALRRYAPRPASDLLSGAEPLPARAKGRQTNSDAAWFLQNRAAAFGEIKPDDRGPEALEAISETFAQEVQYQLSKPDGKQAIGWYDRQLKAAMATIAEAHPEIASNENAGFVFKALLAVTSQGLTVEQNFNVALKIYRRWRDSGSLDLTGVTLAGKAAPIAKKNVDKLAALIKDKGQTGAREWMRAMHTIRELKAAGFKDVSGRMDETVRGWHAFGPKIGSFGNNLDGDFDTLTADLWFSRTWNRTLGTMFQYSPQREANSLRDLRKELVAALNAPGANEVVDALTDEERGQIGNVEFDLELARRLNRRFAANGYKDRSPLNRAAKALTENADMLQDVPRGDPERRWQQQVMRATQLKLAERTGQTISIADLQALLWYQEKELFRTLGAANKASAPLDYQDAAKAAIAKIDGTALGREDTATMIETAFPIGTPFLLGKLKRIFPGARIVPVQFTPKATSRVAIDQTPSEAQLKALAKIGGITRTYPAPFPTSPMQVDEPGARKVPPRYQVPANVAANGNFSALDEEQQEAIDAALEQLKKAGFPRQWLRRIPYFFAHVKEFSHAARFYLRGELRGAISMREDQFAFERLRPGTIVRNLAHELTHAADFDPAVGGFASSESPRLAFQRRTVRDAEGEFESLQGTGDVMAELLDVYRMGPAELGLELSYPFAQSEEYSDDVIKAEAFAQASMLYFTNRAMMRKHAPITSAMIKEMLDAASSADPEHSASAVQGALRAPRVRELDLAVRTVGAGGQDRSGDQGGQTGPGTESGRDDRSGGQPDGLNAEFNDSRNPETPAGKMLAALAEITIPNPFGGGEVVFMHENGGAFGAAEVSGVLNQPAQLYLNSIRSFGAGHGYGSYVLGQITDLADKHGVTLKLLARPYGSKDLTKAQLKAWYKRHGFVVDKRMGPDDMVRAPALDDAGLDMRAPGAPPPAAGFTGYTIPSWRLGDHLTSEAGHRIAGYTGAAKAGGDALRTYLQDYFLPVRRVQEAIEQRGATIDPEADVYGREELYYGRTGEQLRQLEDDHVKPLVEALVAAGVKQDDLELYLYAKFAPARNARIAAINEAMPDGGSGMTNADAAQVLADFDAAGLTAKLEPLAARVRAMNKVRLDVLEEGGLLSPGEAELWREEEHYVPLKGFAEGVGKPGDATRLKTGSGFSIGGREAHRALGRRSRASDLLANTIAQVEQAIIRAEKNRVAVALLRLAEENPNPALWEVDKETQVPYLTPSGEVAYRKDARQQLKENVVAVKVAGEQHYVTLHDPRLASSLRNLGAAKTGAFLRAFSALNRFLSLTRTMLAPEFVLANFSRDLQTASINLTGEQSAAMAARTVRDVPVAMRAMWGHRRNKSQGGEWSRWAKEMAEAGGLTYFVGQQTVEEQQDKIAGLLKDAKGGGFTAIRKLVRGTLDLVEDVNAAVENATRLAAYANARRNGQSIEQAARLAKNLTVNFNRKGQAGPVLNALYLFYNASVQGTARFLRALQQPKVQAIMGATAVLGFGLGMANRAIGGEDDDGEDKWDKISDAEKARNLILFLPGGDGAMIKIPLPYTYNLPFLMGNELEGMLHSKKEPTTAALNVLEAMLTSFSPIGDIDLQGDSATALAKLTSPTAVDPLLDIATNRNFFGGPINPERNPFDKTPDPDSERAFAGTNPAAVWLAKALNRATGGDKVRSGAIDISPGSMVYIFDYLTGGTGSFVERTSTAVMLAAQGEPVPTRKIPFWRVYVGSLDERRITDTFYRVRDDANLKIALHEAAPKGGYDDAGDARDALMGRRLRARLSSTERQLRSVRSRRKEAQAAGNEELAKRLEERERAIQLRFNEFYFKTWDGAAED